MQRLKYIALQKKKKNEKKKHGRGVEEGRVCRTTIRAILGTTSTFPGWKQGSHAP